MKLQNLSLSKKLKLKAKDKDRRNKGEKVADMIFDREPSKDAEDTSLSPSEIVNVDEIVSTDDESDSNSEASDNGSENVEEDIEWPKDIKKQNSMLIDAFTKLYRHFEDLEDDVDTMSTMSSDVHQTMSIGQPSEKTDDSLHPLLEGFLQRGNISTAFTILGTTSF